MKLVNLPRRVRDVLVQERAKPLLSPIIWSLRQMLRREPKKKVEIAPMSMAYPAPIVLCGANVNGQENFATLAACGIIAIKPPLLYVSLLDSHFTSGGILENKSFSVNLPSADMVGVTDYCGISSGKKIDKSELFKIFYGPLKTAPMIEECSVNLECRVVENMEMFHRSVFIGEVMHVYADSDCVTERDGRKVPADLRKLDPIIYGREKKYYRVGSVAAKAYSIGKHFGFFRRKKINDGL